MARTRSSGSLPSLLALLTAMPVTACRAGAPATKPGAHLSAIYDRDGQRLPDSAASSDQVNWIELGANVPDYLRWNGVGTITPGCTATLLKRQGSPSAAAYLITAGHCVLGEFNDPNTILVDTDSSSNAALGRYVASANAPAAVRVRTDRVLYATMKGTDAAILRLGGVTYGELINQNVHPLELAGEAPLLGDALLMPHEPQEGVRPIGLRLSACQVGSSADLREGSYQWQGTFRNHCSAVGGTSGAPIVSAASGKIVGLLTTGTRDATEGSPDCIDSRPCEVLADGSTKTFSDENYGQHVQQIAGCFNGSGDFDLNAAGCGLEKPQAAH